MVRDFEAVVKYGLPNLCRSVCCKAIYNSPKVLTRNVNLVGEIHSMNYKLEATSEDGFVVVLPPQLHCGIHIAGEAYDNCGNSCEKGYKLLSEFHIVKLGNCFSGTKQNVENIECAIDDKHLSLVVKNCGGEGLSLRPSRPPFNYPTKSQVWQGVRGTVYRTLVKYGQKRNFLRKNRQIPVNLWYFSRNLLFL